MKGRMERDQARRRVVINRYGIRQALKGALRGAPTGATPMPTSLLAMDGSLVDRMMVSVRLAREPRAGSLTRLRRRCAWTGRSRGNSQDWQMSRIIFRQKALQGLLPGVRKASW